MKLIRKLKAQICEACNEAFWRHRSDARTCSNRCRVLLFRRGAADRPVNKGFVFSKTICKIVPPRNKPIKSKPESLASVKRRSARAKSKKVKCPKKVKKRAPQKP